jgi:hypothetical protein
MSTKDEQDMDRNAALAQLTDEERAALEEDDLSEDEQAALKDIAGDDDDDDDDDADGDDGSGTGDGSEPAGNNAAAEKTNAAEEDSGAGDSGAGESAAVEDSDDDDLVTPYRAQVPADLAERAKALSDKEQELWTQFDAGDMEREELQTQLRSLEKERREIDRATTKAEIAAEMEQQRGADVARKFYKTIKDGEGIDYSKDETLRDDFIQFIGALEAKNPDKPLKWLLNEAHARTKALHGLGVKAPEKKPDEKPKTLSRKPPIDKLPATLAQVPGGDGPGDVSDEFADIDKLDGFEFEQALKQMTPSQRERYLQAA